MMGNKEEQDLSEMGLAAVNLIRFPGVQCIHKRNASPVELAFYRHSASSLRDAGVNIPELIDISGDDLLLEYIPHSLSVDELMQSPDVYRQLAILHNAEFSSIPLLKLHQWTADQTHQALVSLNLAEKSKTVLWELQQRSPVLFQSQSYISGDTNLGNWGKREDGEIVLFDWERFGAGSPAIDLATLVPNMGEIAAYTDLVELYGEHNRSICGAELLQQIILAKAWIVIEVVNLLVTRNHPEASKCIQWYNDNLPNWFCEVELALKP